MSRVYFIFSIYQTGYHPPEDFPKFGYRSESKVDKFCSILWTGYHPQEDFPQNLAAGQRGK